MALVGYPQPSWGQSRSNTQFRVIYNFTPFSIVGRKKAGILCAPNGKLAWSDIAPLVPATINSLLEKAFFNEAQKTAVDIKATQITAYLTRVDLSLCAKNWGLGEQDAYKGRGTLMVEWKFMGGNSASPIGLANTNSSFKMDGAKQPLEAAFEAAAHDALEKMVVPEEATGSPQH